MANRRFKIFIFVALVAGQVVINRYVRELHMNVDLFYLILVYISVIKGFYQSVAAGMAIGLLTDYLSGNVLGVFGFSRTLAAYFLNELSRHVDLRKNIFVFMLIAVSMFFSNSIANIFFYFILNYRINLSLVLYQPLLTALVGLIIAGTDKAKTYLDVH